MRTPRTSRICLSLQEHNLRRSTNFIRSSCKCVIFGDTGQIERRDWKCKECARQTKVFKSRSGKRENRLAGLRLPTDDKSFEKLEGNQPHCERHG